jgi:hypothetical protein
MENQEILLMKCWFPCPGKTAVSSRNISIPHEAEFDLKILS